MSPNPVIAFKEMVKNDPELAWSWHCNIAVSSMDEGMAYKAANKAAARFMATAFGVDMSTFPEYRQIMSHS